VLRDAKSVPPSPAFAGPTQQSQKAAIALARPKSLKDLLGARMMRLPFSSGEAGPLSPTAGSWRILAQMQRIVLVNETNCNG
jgi:hypothetical protein